MNIEVFFNFCVYGSRMASSTLCLLWSALWLGYMVKGQGSIDTFQVTQPTGPIYEGAQVQLQCRVDGFQSATDTVVIYHNYINGGFRTLANENGKDYEAPENVLSTGIQQDSTSHVLFVTINDIDMSFSTDYSCYTGKKAGIISDQDQLAIAVLLPTPPSCLATPENELFMWYDGDELTLTCTSEIVERNPLHVVMLTWSIASPGDNVPSLPSAEQLALPDGIESTMNLVVTDDHDGATFTCLRETDQQNCSIGPLVIRPVPVTRRFIFPSVTDNLNPDNTDATETTMNSTLDTYVTVSASPRRQHIGIIVAIVAIIVVLVIIVIIAVVCYVFRSSRQSEAAISKKRRPSSKRVTSLDIVHVAGKDDTPNVESKEVKVQHTSTPGPEGEVYAMVQKRPSQVCQIKPRASKTYPEPPAYPRPPKGQEKDGSHYANARVVSGVPIEATAEMENETTPDNHYHNFNEIENTQNTD